MIISIDAGKALGKNPYPKALIKTPSKLKIEEKFLNFVKGIYESPVTNSNLNGKKLNVSLLSL